MSLPLLSFQVQIGNLHRPLDELEVWDPLSHHLIAVLPAAMVSTIFEHYFMHASLTTKLQEAIRETARDNLRLTQRWRST